MRSMDHPNVISLKHCFFSTTSKDELFLNLVMEYVPETLYRVLKHYSNVNQRMPLIYVKLYTYQVQQHSACPFMFYLYGFLVIADIFYISVHFMFLSRFLGGWLIFTLSQGYAIGM